MATFEELRLVTGGHRSCEGVVARWLGPWVGENITYELEMEIPNELNQTTETVVELAYHQRRMVLKLVEESKPKNAASHAERRAHGF